MTTSSENSSARAKSARTWLAIVAIMSVITFAITLTSSNVNAENPPAAQGTPGPETDEGPSENGSRNITREQMLKENTLGKSDEYKEPPKDSGKIAANPDGQVKVEEEKKPDGPPPRVQIIMDSSGSMGQLLQEGKTKMYFAKKLLSRYFKDQWQQEASTGLRVYGSKRKNDCDDNFQSVKFGERSLYAIEEKVEKMYPVGRTPLNESLVRSVKDLKDYPGPKRIVIFTDGEETCGGDPCKTAKELRSQKELDVQVYVVAIGFKPGSDALKKVQCLGGSADNTAVANNEDDLFSAMGKFSNKSTHPNLKVISPLPTAQVLLYKINGKERTYFRSFTAAWGINVPPGEYEALVYLDPIFRFEKFRIPPLKTVTLKVDGKGTVTVNFVEKLMNVEILDASLKVVQEFKSDTPTKVPTGKWKLRIFKEPFYDFLLQKFIVFPNGKHEFEVGGAGAFIVNTPQVDGFYVYDGKDSLVGNYLTNFPTVIKTGEYRVHVNDQCSFEKVVVSDDKRIKPLECEAAAQFKAKDLNGDKK